LTIETVISRALSQLSFRYTEIDTLQVKNLQIKRPLLV